MKTKIDSNKVRNRIMLRWTVFTTAFLTLYWILRILIEGGILLTNTAGFLFSSKFQIVLPFYIPRFTDILIGPLWSIIFIYLYYNRKKNDEDESDLTMIYDFLLIATLIIGFCSFWEGILSATFTLVVVFTTTVLISLIIWLLMTVCSVTYKWLSAN